MSDLEKIKRDLFRPLLEKGDRAGLKEAGEIWLSAAQSEKLALEIATGARATRSESMRFWVPIMAPLITAAALVLTFVLQLNQFKENNKAQREANEDTQWRQMLSNVKSTTGPEGVFGLTLLKSFLDSERYRNQAREIAVLRLAHTADPDSFQVLFPDIMRRTDWKSFKDIVAISAGLLNGYNSIPDEPDTKSSFSTGPGSVSVRPSPGQVKSDLGRNLDTVGQALITFLRDPRHYPRPLGIDLDISGADFSNKDLADMDLSDAVVIESNFNNCSVNGVNFGRVTRFEDSNWSQTAWWRAKSISPELLKYLTKSFKYDAEKQYLNDTTGDQAEYDREIVRLSSHSSEST
jgi:hypothetical protein